MSKEIFDRVIEICYKNAREKYGAVLPDFIAGRIKDETKKVAYSDYLYAPYYELAYKISQKCKESGYKYWVRGRLGSSFIAYLSGITNVNPLPPHFYCRACGKASASHPNCGHDYIKDGLDIPCEAFMGYDGSKVPDIEISIFSKEISGILDLLDEYKTIPDFDTHNILIHSDDFNCFDCMANHTDFGDALSEYGLKHGIFKTEMTMPFAFSDDIFNHLVASGIERETAYKIAHYTRKGRFDEIATDCIIDTLKAHNVDDYYISALKNAEYLFPKAHAAEYLLTVGCRV